MKFGKKATCVCRCGDGGVSGIACKRGPRCAIDYQARISGPMMDRIDLQIDVPAVSAADLALPPPAEGSAEVAARVAAARSAQLSRGEGAEGGHTNADITTAMVEQVAAPDEAGRALLAKAAEKMKLSARAYHRTLRVARTIADLDGAESVRRVHIAEALSHRRAPPESYTGQSGSRAASAR